MSMVSSDNYLTLMLAISSFLEIWVKFYCHSMKTETVLTVIGGTLEFYSLFWNMVYWLPLYKWHQM